MNQIDKLHTLFMLCKTGVFIEYNEHKQFNDNVEEFLIGQQERKFVENEVWDKIVRPLFFGQITNRKLLQL